MWNYTDKVKEHFLNPRNVGELKDANAIGETGSLNCGDALTEIIKGMTLDEAAKITNDDIADFLGGLPKEKMHCSVMGKAALKKAIANYRGVQILEKPGELVCECFEVTDLEIIDAVKANNLQTTEDVTDYLKAGGGCGKCLDRIEEVIESVKAKG
ncbi:MAG: iron-sulfur cluster assembly scaffold protein [Desulfobacteraceae bacterium]|nr:iron-sulfur cluster assembly scaffold protein [Desulfobacteraceae bacterium]